MYPAQELQAKAQVYKTLSLAFSSPSPSALKGVAIDSLKRALGLIHLDLCLTEAAKIEDYLEKLEDGTELAVEYTRLFRGPVKAETYPYESMYVDGEIMGHSTMEVMRCYAEVGLASAENFRDLPDHISVELEFLYYLCSLQHHFLEGSDPDEAMRVEGLRRSFLLDHFARWAPAFADGVIRNTASPFYRGFATIAREFLQAESEALLSKVDNGGTVINECSR